MHCGTCTQRAKGPNVEALIYSNAVAVIDLPAMRVRSFAWMLQRSNANASGPQGWGSVRNRCFAFHSHVAIAKLPAMLFT